MMRYTVKPGDTLQFIAMQFYGSFIRWPEIWNANCEVIIKAQQLEARRLRNMQGPDWIFPGTALRIPERRKI